MQFSESSGESIPRRDQPYARVVLPLHSICTLGCCEFVGFHFPKRSQPSEEVYWVQLLPLLSMYETLLIISAICHMLDPIKWHPHFVIMDDKLLRRVYRATCTVVDDYMKTYSRLLRYDVTMMKGGCHLIGSSYLIVNKYCTPKYASQIHMVQTWFLVILNSPMIILNVFVILVTLQCTLGLSMTCAFFFHPRHSSSTFIILVGGYRTSF